MTAKYKPKPFGWLAVVLSLAGLAIVFAALAYVWILHRRDAGAEPPTDPIQRLKLMLAAMLVAVLSIIGFLLGSYLVIRVGKSLLNRKIGGQPTTYVDAWSNYRLTEEEIDSVSEPGQDDENENGPNKPPFDDDDGRGHDRGDAS